MDSSSDEVVYPPADLVSCWFAMTSAYVSFDVGVAGGEVGLGQAVSLPLFCRAGVGCFTLALPCGSP